MGSLAVPFAKIKDFQLYYEVRGTGTPLILIPGLPAISSDWYPFAASLSESFTVITYDNRGSGQSSEPEGRYTIPLMAEDVVRLLDVLRIERAHVFGISMGGMIAQELTIRWGHRVDRLVLGCTHAGGSHFIQPEAEVIDAFALTTDDWGERMRRFAPLAFSLGYLRSQPDAIARFVEKKTQDFQSYSGYRRQYGAANRHDAFGRLGQISHRTLIITGTEDRVVVPENSRVLCTVIPNAKLATIEKAGHLFFVEQPGLTLDRLLPFIRGKDGPD